MVFAFNKNGSEDTDARIIPLLPLRDSVIFPFSTQCIYVGRKKSINAVTACFSSDRMIFVITQRNPSVEEPDEESLYGIGTLCQINQVMRLSDGSLKVIITGKRRAQLINLIRDEGYLKGEVEELTEISGFSEYGRAILEKVKTLFDNYCKINRGIPSDVAEMVVTSDNEGRVADIIANHLNISIHEKQSILENLNTVDRLEEVLSLLNVDFEILQVERKIKSRVKKQMEKTQKEFYLNEQLKAIQKELGYREDVKSEIEELEERIKEKGMSKEANRKALHELKKLKMMSPMSAEATVVRNYIDWLISLPWNERTEDKLDIREAENILNEDHYGLENVKERILEYLAVRSLVGRMKSPILCLVGPPGVGKTSLAKSIARATGRRFVRVSLGGVRDEAEIRGHRRTYIGALPGKIIQYMRKAGTINPVFLLDEVDKMSADFRGDPAAALLEVLDPEQNHAFNDHYLDVDYNLSEVMFITTANTLHQIPPALLDRMEVIRIPGYTELEKLNIAKHFLVKKQLNAHGLTERNLRFTENALLKIIRNYTKEAGVRNLEREIARICRKVAKEVLKHGRDYSVKITVSKLESYLGPIKYRFGVIEERDRIGVAMGLAWTEFGGEILATEVTVMPGKGELIITGKLGEVMRESARAALSYVRSRADIFGLERDFYQKIDIHIHIPEGAIPKDGPSAGITMATSIVSALLKVPVRRDIAMTGEITLRGTVLPVGGIKEKILAAHRAGVSTVIIPKENDKDLKEIPGRILRSMKIILVDDMDDVLKNALIYESEEVSERRQGFLAKEVFSEKIEADIIA